MPAATSAISFAVQPGFDSFGTETTVSTRRGFAFGGSGAAGAGVEATGAFAGAALGALAEAGDGGAGGASITAEELLEAAEAPTRLANDIEPAPAEAVAAAGLAVGAAAA